MDWDSRSFTLSHDPAQTSQEAIFETIKGLGFKPSDTPLSEADQGKELSKTELARLDVKTISKGKTFAFADHMVPGKITIFDYYADWCGPCLVLGRELETLSIERGDIAIRKADLIDWKSELAQHLTKTYKLPGIPYLRIYGPDGKLLGTVGKNDIDAVKALLPPVAK